MKHCPKCRVESRDDAEWCWHCGYAYDDGEADRAPPDAAESTQQDPEQIDPS